MGETAHIAEIADKLAKELFAEFLWKRVGATNQNWPCEDPTKHEVQTHPSDVVFSYDEPYAPIRTYVNCDLKSYAVSTISRGAVKEALVSLAQQVSCAEKSDAWRNLYIDSHITPSVCGLLFVYNHDGAYDKSFRELLRPIKNESLDLPKGSRLYVLGPEDIYWLDNVRYEIRSMRGAINEADRLPAPEHCNYFYPQLIRKANVQLEKARAANLEMLTAPWIILEYRKPESNGRRSIVVFYRRSGELVGEFLYLIDYLRHYQVLQEDTDVHIKVLDTFNTAHSMFQKAITQYIDEMSAGDGSTELAERVRAIKYSKISQVLTSFSPIELGMK